MEIPEDVLRKIVRETMRELGPGAEADLVRKVVKEVLRRISRHDATAVSPQIAPQPSYLPPH